MAVGDRLRAIRPPTSWSEALLAGIVTAAVYPLVVIGFALAIYWAPYYLALYALVGGVEHLYRR